MAISNPLTHNPWNEHQDVPHPIEYLSVDMNLTKSERPVVTNGNWWSTTQRRDLNSDGEASIANQTRVIFEILTCSTDWSCVSLQLLEILRDAPVKPITLRLTYLWHYQKARRFRIHGLCPSHFRCQIATIHHWTIAVRSVTVSQRHHLSPSVRKGFGVGSSWGFVEL
jgi:hypothetical protein